MIVYLLCFPFVFLSIFFFFSLICSFVLPFFSLSVLAVFLFRCFTFAFPFRFGNFVFPDTEKRQKNIQIVPKMHHTRTIFFLCFYFLLSTATIRNAGAGLLLLSLKFTAMIPRAVYIVVYIVQMERR